MITNTGKGILAKYLISQAPAYASYIAVGCGPKPLNTDGTFADYSSKQNLDFEMFRIPIISRGYVTENSISKIVLTGELPSEERYEITELGVYSEASNPTAGSTDSKLIYAFTQTENWEYHTASAAVAIPTIYEALDGAEQDNVINVTQKVFQTNADNRIFTNTTRASRYERCRFLNNIIIMSGDDADLIVDGVSGYLVPNPDTVSNHIHLIGTGVDFNQNSPTDQLRFAFSIINKDGASLVQPDEIKILVEFASTDDFGVGQFARFEVKMNAADYLLDENRYYVMSKELQDLIKSPAFTWSTVDVVKIYTTVIKDGLPSPDYYIALDALRLENVSSQSPLYGLTGYSVIKNQDAATIVKVANTTNFVEFRFAIDVAVI